jgi:hypothetical protein
VRIFAALVISGAAVVSALLAYEPRFARPALEGLWRRVRSGEPPTPDPGWGFVRRLRGWAPYVQGILDTPANTRAEQVAAVGVAVVMLLPVVVWVILAVWLYQLF